MNAYIVIRVPKCGSTSLARMITKSLPDSNVFYISSAGIELAHEENENISPFEKFRIYKNSTRSIWKKHRCLSFDAVWEKTNRRIKDGDIIHGHLTVDAIRLENFNKKLISVIRDPYNRMLSEYNYTRRAYNNKNFISKNYKNKLHAAGNYSFEGYISYLKENQPLHARYMSRFLIGKKKHTNPIEFVRDNYFALGILERMDLFIEDFYKKSNIRLNQYKTNITKSKEHIDLSANERKAVKDFCDEDIDLYMNIKNIVERYDKF